MNVSTSLPVKYLVSTDHIGNSMYGCRVTKILQYLGSPSHLLHLPTYSRRKYYATIKMRNNLCYLLIMVIFPIFSNFSLCFSFYMSFVVWFMTSFLYCFPYIYRSSNYCDSNSCRSLTLLKALAKSNGNLITIAFNSKKEQQLLLSR